MQYELDVALLNEIANEEAIRQGYCDQWERIIRRINDATNNRLGLKGRHPMIDVIITVRIKGVVSPASTTDRARTRATNEWAESARVNLGGVYSSNTVVVDEARWEMSE